MSNYRKRMTPEEVEMALRDVDPYDQMSIHTATKKDHRCTLCGKRIPLGAKYWSSPTGGRREHTNCDVYTREPDLPDGYNHNRSLYKQPK